MTKKLPSISRLLTVPLRAHGTAEASIFPPHRRQLYDQLVAWVKLTTSDEAEQIGEVPPANEPAPFPVSSVGDRYSTEGNLAPATYNEPRYARRGSPRVQYGAHRPAQLKREPLGPEAISERISKVAKEALEQPPGESSEQPLPQPVEETPADVAE